MKQQQQEQQSQPQPQQQQQQQQQEQSKKIVIKNRSRWSYQHIWQHFRRHASLEEIRTAAARICRDYLTGRWKVVTPEQLIVKRISGGLSNFLYYVSLPEDDEAGEATKIVSETATSTIAASSPTLAVESGSIDVTAATGTTVVATVDAAAETVIGIDKNSNAEHATGLVGQQQKQRQKQQQQQQQQHQQQQQEHERQQIEYSLVLSTEECVVAQLEGAIGKAQKRPRSDSDFSEQGSAKRLQAFKKEPREVLLRIYGQTQGGDALESMITESVVFALLSERNFGPKLHGIFPGGRIEQYIPARPLSTIELSDPKISMKIAEKMGEIHSLNIPVSKEPDWLWNCMERWLQGMDNIMRIAVEGKNVSPTILKQSDFMRTIDYVEEMKWLKSLIDAGNYKVTFCHNDLQEGNILFKTTPTTTVAQSPRDSLSSLRSNFDETLGDSLDGNANLDDKSFDGRSQKESPTTRSTCLELDTADDSALDNSFCIENEPDLIIIDFEYCAYNYRGFDLANHFLEWTFDYTNSEFPFYHHHKQQYPSEVQRRNFIVNYLRKLHDTMITEGEQYEPCELEISSLEQEVRIFSMFSHLFWSLWSIVNVASNIEFGYWDYAVKRILEFQALKAEHIARNSQK